MAGYTGEMRTFLAANTGLASRCVPVEFPSYDVDELLVILRNMAAKKGYRLTPEAEDRLRAWFARASVAADFGNARTARELLEAIESRLAERVDGDPAADHDEIRGEDVPDAGA
jgi:hypothetical protein